jgi:glycosyltransferase involved in cell wall biosynthesis
MNIYFDGLFFKQSGIGRYYETLLAAFLERGISVYTCVNINYRKDFESKFISSPLLNTIYIDYKYFTYNNLINHSILLRKIKNNVDIYFFPHINIPFILPKNSILTLHDFRSYTHYWDRSFQKKIITRLLYSFAINSASNFVCISRETQRFLKHIDKKAHEKSHYIYEFIDTKFQNHKHSSPHISHKYVLFVGTRKKHKNILTALQAFAQISHTIPHDFVLAGRRDTGSCEDELDVFIARNNLGNRIIQIFSPTDDEVANLYRHADLFVFPSLFEGFGLPPLEAVACGCPAILSDLPIFHEIFSDSALYFAPRSADALASLMVRLLTDEQARAELLAKEKNRLKLFDKNKIVASYLNLFERVAR